MKAWLEEKALLNCRMQRCLIVQQGDITAQHPAPDEKTIALLLEAYGLFNQQQNLDATSLNFCLSQSQLN